jgi:hypothetical protein
LQRLVKLTLPSTLCVQATYNASSLDPYPPVGSKNALCYQDSADAGNAQCTADCVPVTAFNGTTFYPVVCHIVADMSPALIRKGGHFSADKRHWNKRYESPIKDVSYGSANLRVVKDKPDVNVDGCSRYGACTSCRRWRCRPPWVSTLASLGARKVGHGKLR